MIALILLGTKINALYVIKCIKTFGNIMKIPIEKFAIPRKL